MAFLPRHLHTFNCAHFLFSLSQRSGKHPHVQRLLFAEATHIVIDCLLIIATRIQRHLSGEQRLREARALPPKERPDDVITETPSTPHARSTPQSMSMRLRKRDQYLGSGHATGFENGSGEKRAAHTIDVKTGSSERSESLPAKAPGLSPLTTATLTPPLGQFIINLLLQLAGIAAAVAFGIFAVESLNVAKQANIEARVAN